MKKQQTIFVLTLWAALTLAVWFHPAQDISQAERRALAQLPEFSLSALENGQFREEFEDYSLDQFPLRQGFRRLKALFHTQVLGMKDSSGIYLTNGIAVKQEYPLSEASLNAAIRKFDTIHEKFLGESRCFFAVVPDKGYYLAGPSGHLAMDYDVLYEKLEKGLPWAEQIDLRPTLTAGDYYRTDTHWRQERLLPAATAICEALGVTAPKAEDYSRIQAETPFYGVYYGQAALPMEPDSLTWLESETLRKCTVYDYETGKTGAVYDTAKLTESRDPYDVFLSGARAVLTVENPNAKTDWELIVFRDSFGSSLVPLLLGDYAKVTLVDIRYVSSAKLDSFLDFHGQDVLFLYSTLVLNSSSSLK